MFQPLPRHRPRSPRLSQFYRWVGEFSEVARLSEGIEVDGMALRVLGCAGKLDLALSGPFSAWLHPAVSTMKPISPASPSLPGEKTARSRADEQVFRHSLTLDALIKAKTTLDRPRDREAIRQLEAIRQIKRDNAKG